MLNLLAFGLAEAVGYRTVAITPGTDAAQAHRSAVVSALYLGTLLRLAITATPVFFSLLAAFVANGSQFWTYWCGASWAAVSMLWRLDRAGGRSALVAAVGLQPAAHADRFAA